MPFFTTVLDHVRSHETGSAAGLLNAVQQLGGTLGVALLGSVLFRITTTSGTLGQDSVALTGARNACRVAAVLVLATAVARLHVSATAAEFRTRQSYRRT